tara:strand:- start:1848 stop:2063 length:216 start_codon:yes stop_codon:yes gene_type:complete
METELTRLATIELAAIRASMELIGDNKMDATVAAEFVKLLMKQIDKIENDELIYREHISNLNTHYERENNI